MKSLIEQAYDADEFRQKGHDLVDTLADYLETNTSGTEKRMFTPFEPDELYDLWSSRLKDGSSDGFEVWSRNVLNDSIHLHHPGYMGHQVSPVLPEAALADFMGSMLNNGMGVYEMGSPTVAMERAVIKQLASQLGFKDKADGILTSGGTLGNLTALLAARQVMTERDAWNEGTGHNQLAFMVSEEAHYSIARAVKILGWGEKGIVKVPTDNEYRLKPERLNETYEKALTQGIMVIGVVGSACSTATGSFDPLDKIAAFCKKKDLWFHVDAAHGGAAVYSQKYRHLTKGIDQADSAIVDFHKMLMCPALVTGLVFKDGSHSYQTFAQKADYLWSREDEEWFNLGKRTFECTKDMMALKVYSIFNSYGTKLFEEIVDRLFSLGTVFADLIRKHPDFELLTDPQCNIVCFRYAAGSVEDLNEHNSRLRDKLIEEGHFYIVQTRINDRVYLRTTLMNVFTTETHLKKLLEDIERLGTNLV